MCVCASGRNMRFISKVAGVGTLPASAEDWRDGTSGVDSEQKYVDI